MMTYLKRLYRHWRLVQASLRLQAYQDLEKKYGALSDLRDAARHQAEVCKAGLSHDQADATMQRVDRLASIAAYSHLTSSQGLQLQGVVGERDVLAIFLQEYRMALLPGGYSLLEEQERA